MAKDTSDTTSNSISDLAPFHPLPEHRCNSDIAWTKPKFDSERLRTIWAFNEWEDSWSA